jgi:hypothetical protein
VKEPASERGAAVWEHVKQTRTIDKTIGRWREAIGAPMRGQVAA